MTTVMVLDLPENALLQRYAKDPGSYTDCFARDVAGRVDLARFVRAFYTTPLFKAERLVLRLAGYPSSDGAAADLAQGHTGRFAAWTVEAREAQQVLMCDAQGRTRSWFMVAPAGSGTRLYFGSAVTQRDHWAVRLLLPLHQIYARALLRSVKL